MKTYYEKIIINQKSSRGYADYEFIEACMKEALRQAIPIILKDAADNVEEIFNKLYDVYEIDKKSIINREEPLRKFFDL